MFYTQLYYHFNYRQSSSGVKTTTYYESYGPFHLIYGHSCHTDSSFKTLFILMDYPIYIETINKELSSLYFKGLLVKISIKLCISVPECCFYLS